MKKTARLFIVYCETKSFFWRQTDRPECAGGCLPAELVYATAELQEPNLG